MVQSIKEIKDNLDGLSLSDKDRSIEMLNNILSQLPKEYSDFINEAFTYKRIPKEYLLCSILFSISTAVGMTFYINSLGYVNYANLYFTIIGSRGDTKSEAMKIATEPLKELDDQDYDEYCIKKKMYNPETNREPIRKQLLIQNATIEAVHKIHYENPNSVGVLIDEIFSLIEKMGNSSSRDGVAWRGFLLEGYNNGCVDISRKTTDSYRIKKAYPTLLGGLQYQFIPKLFANGNLESGFIDRLLFTPKLTSNNKLLKGEMSNDVLDAYSNSVLSILAYKRQSEKLDEDIKQFEIKFSNEAEEKLFKYTQGLIDRKEKAGNMIKEYIAKMQISIHKFCLLVHMMIISSNMDYTKILDENTVDLAIMLNEYYFNNFKIILDENLSNAIKEPSIDEIIKLAKKNNASQKAVAEITGLHKGTVSKRWNKFQSNQQLATSKTLKDTG